MDTVQSVILGMTSMMSTLLHFSIRLVSQRTGLTSIFINYVGILRMEEEKDGKVEGSGG